MYFEQSQIWEYVKEFNLICYSYNFYVFESFCLVLIQGTSFWFNEVFSLVFFFFLIKKKKHMQNGVVLLSVMAAVTDL